jgi:hypothetical protein
MLAIQEKHMDKHKVDGLSHTMASVLKVLERGGLSRKEIFSAVGMNADHRSFERDVKPPIDAICVEMTVPDKPDSELQMYRLTERGRVENLNSLWHLRQLPGHDLNERTPLLRL